MNEKTELDRIAARLTADHNLRMRRIDPRIAPAPVMPEHHVIGTLAIGRIQEQRYDENAYASLWGALCRYILHIRVAGPDPGPAFDQVMVGLLDRIDADPDRGADQAVTLTWPSLDTACAAPLVRHGFAPLTSLVVKKLHRPDDLPGGTIVRPAQRDDLEWLADQAHRLHRFENQLGVLPDRPALRARLHTELAEAMADENCFILVASTDKTPVGFIQGQVPSGAWIEQQITMKPAGYLSRLFIEPAARRKSVGRSLVAAAHDILRGHGATAVMLHHSLHNPFAAPFWAESGYRPTLTTWSKRVH
ncbi:GNAT family N-acetyltransferase [Streptomyces sp. NPDC007901]|uniref:GNAT family N-acetyltransferase n=1 Tax=Streptomyces sp. NPDC007901 TaxID=3364785 RepID=UPI0036E9C49D